MGAPVVEVRELTKVYRPFPPWLRIMIRSQVRSPVVALDRVTFRVEAGEICGVIGPNGAGKSTLFRVLTGLTTPTSGSASVFGNDVVDRSPEVRRRIGFVPADDRSLMLRQTCATNLAFHGRLRGMSEESLRVRIDETLELVGLSRVRDRVGFALSAGMRARLQLARAILHEPELLILDEPTASVDPVSSHDMLRLLRTYAAERRVAVLVSSHRVEEIEALHDNVVLLDRGRLLHCGDLGGLRDLWERPMLQIEFEGNEGARAAGGLLTGRPGVESVERHGRLLTIQAHVRTGRILQMLDGKLPGVVAVREVRMPLRQLIALVTHQAGSGRRG